MFFKSISNSGDVNKDVDKIIPPFGVALPVKLVRALEMVKNKSHLIHVLNIIAHSVLFLGLTNMSA